MAFNPKGDLPTVDFVEELINQNLHAMPVPEMLIICPPDFRMQADELADFHAEQDGLDVRVVAPQEIYNEFSSM